jgi:hypothetical protein
MHDVYSTCARDCLAATTVPLATRFSSRSMLLTDHIGSTLAIIVAIIVVPYKNNFVRKAPTHRR